MCRSTTRTHSANSRTYKFRLRLRLGAVRRLRASSHDNYTCLSMLLYMTQKTKQTGRKYKKTYTCSIFPIKKSFLWWCFRFPYGPCYIYFAPLLTKACETMVHLTLALAQSIPLYGHRIFTSFAGDFGIPPEFQQTREIVSHLQQRIVTKRPTYYIFVGESPSCTHFHSTLGAHMVQHQPGRLLGKSREFLEMREA